MGVTTKKHIIIRRGAKNSAYSEYGIREGMRRICSPELGEKRARKALRIVGVSTGHWPRILNFGGQGCGESEDKPPSKYCSGSTIVSQKGGYLTEIFDLCYVYIVTHFSFQNYETKKETKWRKSWQLKRNGGQKRIRTSQNEKSRKTCAKRKKEKSDRKKGKKERSYRTIGY